MLTNDTAVVIKDPDRKVQIAPKVAQSSSREFGLYRGKPKIEGHAKEDPEHQLAATISLWRIRSDLRLKGVCAATAKILRRGPI